MADSQAKVSIVIAQYNHEELTTNLLIDIECLELDGCEIVIVDDGSRDQPLPGLYESVYFVDKFIQHDFNQGVSKSWNDGIKAATGDYIFILNNDLRIRDPRFVEKCIEALDAEKCIVGTVLRDANELTRYKGRCVPYLQGEFLAVKRATFDEIGLFDEDFSPFLFEDAEFSARATMHGYALKVMDIDYEHKRHSTMSAEVSPETERAVNIANRLKFIQKLDAMGYEHQAPDSSVRLPMPPTPGEGPSIPYPHIHFVHPYAGSRAMDRSIEAIKNALGCRVSVSAEVNPQATLNYHMPHHALANLERPTGLNVCCYTHTNPGQEAQTLEACYKADHIIVQSYAGRRELLDFGIPIEKITVIPKGSNSYRPRKKVIGIVGAEQPNGRKHSSILLDLAWKMDLSPFAFRIVGTGWTDVVTKLANTGVAVEYAEYLADDQMEAFYHSLDLLLVTGYVEGGPLPILEAFAAGVPVLSPAFGYAVDYLPKSSIYKDTDELISKLVEVAKPSLVHSTLANLYSWERWGEHNAEVLSDLLGRNEFISLSPRGIRHRQILDIIDQLTPRSITEVGFWHGDLAVQMIQRAQRYNRTITYTGYDLFEDAPAGIAISEGTPGAVSTEVADLILRPLKVQYSLIKGDSNLTLNRYSPADLTIIDGGHSPATCESDWQHISPKMRSGDVVVFDDYCDHPLNFTSKHTVDAIDRSTYDVEVLPHMDHCDRPWGVLGVQMVKVTRR